MRIQIASDLHVHHWAAEGRGVENLINSLATFGPGIPTPEVLILAGDIIQADPSMIDDAASILKAFAARYENVVLVPGNHEFYGTSIDEGTHRLFELEQKIPGLHVLVPGRVLQIGGQRFLGGTGWHPTSGDSVENATKIIDSRLIKAWRQEAGQHFKTMMSFLHANVQMGDIVVTHHAPSLQSLAPQWVGHPANRFFITHEFSEIIQKNWPAYWIHGHVHTPFDYVQNSTRVIANPRGYPGEGVKFDPNLTIEVP